MARYGIRRTAAASLAVLHLVLALAATHHAGAHLDEGLAWLPSDLHHHAYRLTELPDELHLRTLDPCLACHIARAAWRLTASSAGTAAGDVVRLATGSGPAGAIPCTDPSTRTSRGPPLA